ncbi:MAG: hypothetical protein CVU43_10680 [Chloroflexi bacterium HGW-Chloroflexi-5]|nr:MAG: hypothetical protein CVU43_10680 [Chloroflexi bacterium HGW-Chloroflexi-5]
MKKQSLITCSFLIVLAVLLIANPPSPALADVNNSNSGLCIPGESDLFVAQDCQMAGPAKTLDELQQQGIMFPAAPLYVANPPASLGDVSFSYAKVVEYEEIPLYDSLEAISTEQTKSKLPSSRTKYVSLYDKAETEMGLYYKIANGKWISREYISKVGVQFFQGYEFKENPTVSFGWILDVTKSRSGPFSNAPETGKEYFRYDVVNVYDSEMEGELEWLMIGPNEWINHRFISRVIPNTEKPAGVETDRWIEINLYEQVMLVHEGDRIVYATLVTTGSEPFFTQPGVFKIYKKIDHEYMRGSFEADRSDYYYLEDVPYIMYYDQARALHGAYWHTNFGYKSSHGCVNLSIADAHWLFDWANMDETVYVWDPSGNTPTDPEYYGAGGA